MIHYESRHHPNGNGLEPAPADDIRWGDETGDWQVIIRSNGQVLINSLSGAKRRLDADGVRHFRKMMDLSYKAVLAQLVSDYNRINAAIESLLAESHNHKTEEREDGKETRAGS